MARFSSVYGTITVYSEVEDMFDDTLEKPFKIIFDYAEEHGSYLMIVKAIGTYENNNWKVEVLEEEKKPITAENIVKYGIAETAVDGTEKSIKEQKEELITYFEECEVEFLDKVKNLDLSVVKELFDKYVGCVADESLLMTLEMMDRLDDYMNDLKKNI